MGRTRPLSARGAPSEADLDRMDIRARELLRENPTLARRKSTMDLLELEEKLRTSLGF